MKPLHKHYDYLIHVALFSFLSITIALLGEKPFVQTLQAHWIFLLLAILIAFSPFGKIQLGKKSSRPLPLIRWFFLNLLMAIAITFIYAGWFIVSIKIIPISPLPDSTNLLLITTQKMIFSWGFYPWAIFILTAITLAYFNYYKKGSGFLSAALQPLLKNKPEDSITITVDFYVRAVILFCLANMTACVILFSLGLLSYMLHIPLNTHLHLGTLLISTFLVLLAGSKNWHPIIHYLSIMKIPPIIVVCLFVFIFTLFIFLLNFLVNLLNVYYPPLLQTLLTLHYIDISHSWFMFSGIWWISWTPLLAGLMAYTSQGYSIRTVIIMGMILAVFTNAILLGLAFISYALIDYLLLLIGFAILLALFIRNHYLIYLMRAILPDTQPQKWRSSYFYIRAWLQVTMFIILLFFPLGFIGLNVLTFFVAFPLAVIFALVCVSLVRGLIASTPS